MSPLPSLLLGAVVFLSRWRGDAFGLPSLLPRPADQPAGAALAQLAGHLAVLAALLLAGAGLAAAGRCVRQLLLRKPTPADAPVLDGACGLAVAAALWLGLGLAGLAFPAVAAVFAVGVAAAGGRSARACARAARGRPGLAVLALVAVVPALVPETEVDALVYHLALPDAYARAHRVFAAAPAFLGGYWQGQEMLALPGLLLGVEPVAKGVGLLALALAAAGAAALARRWAGGTAAGLAGALVLVTPAAVLGAARSKNDLLAASLVGAALVARAGGAGAGRALLAGLLAGAAVATKNTAVLAVPALLVTLRPGRAWAACLAGVAVPVLPWLARNGLGLRNPVFPLAMGFLPSPGMGALDRTLADRYTRLWREAAPGGAFAAAVAAVQLLAGFHPLSLIGWVAAVRLPRRAAWPGVFLAVFALAWLSGLAWFGRFALPLLVPLTALGAAWLAQGASAAPRFARAAALAAAGPALRPFVRGAVALAALVTLAGPAWRDAPLGCALGWESRAGYFGRAAGSWAGATAAVRRLVPPGRHVLVVGDWRSYPAAGRLAARWLAEESAPHELARTCGDAARMRIRLRQWRVSHLLYNLPQAAYRASYAAARPWSRAGVARWASFLDGKAGLAWRSDRQDPVQGFFLLYAIDGRVPPFRAWLPGVEGEFDALRERLGISYADAGVDRELARLDALLGPRAELLARHAAVLALRGRAPAALAASYAAVRAAPEAQAAWVVFGANVMTRPAELATYTRLWREFVDLQVTLGVPTALPPR